jgi:hypothetical protein
VHLTISLTRRQWQILDQIRGNVPRGKYLWSFLAQEIRNVLGDVPGSEEKPYAVDKELSVFTSVPPPEKMDGMHPEYAWVDEAMEFFNG